jgi:hypothetical protein
LVVDLPLMTVLTADSVAFSVEVLPATMMATTRHLPLPEDLRMTVTQLLPPKVVEPLRMQLLRMQLPRVQLPRVQLPRVRLPRAQLPRVNLGQGA